MNSKSVKKALNDTIREMTEIKQFFSRRPDKDYTRTRKLTFEKIISAVLAFRAGTLNHELMDFFGLEPSAATSSAFIQQRAKIFPEAFEYLFRSFTEKIDENKRYRGYRLFAVDGSDLQIAANSRDPDSFFPGTDGKKPYSLLHINAMYDLLQAVYSDALIQKSRCSDECGALTEMVDRSAVQNGLLIADRGYEAYNVLAHIQEKGWCFLVRIKDGSNGISSGLSLPDTEEYDVPFDLHITRKQTNAIKQLLRDRNHYKFLSSNTRFDYLPSSSGRHEPTVFYNLRFRIVRFHISETVCESIITNLDPGLFPASEIKRLYAMRWGIETSFRDLKHTLGLLHLHAKKVEFVFQEIFAKLTMYNFCERITRSVVIQQGKRKHNYKVNFSDSVHICFKFFLGKLSPPRLETLLAKFISPIRPGRSDKRKPSQRTAISFLYRVA